MKLLLISNSTNPGEAYLDYPKFEIKQFLENNTSNLLFIPYAAVTLSYDEYERKVKERFEEIGLEITSIHHFPDPQKAVREASAIVVGGGNTWKLVRTLRDHGLINLIADRIKGGVPYIGWSAGSNVACPTLRTTNDMPIIDPIGFDTMNLVPFQINPHYLDVHPENHGGETREMRILEFIAENKPVSVVGLREGTMLCVEGQSVKLIGNKTARIFRHGSAAQELSSDDDFSFLLR